MDKIVKSVGRAITRRRPMRKYAKRGTTRNLMKRYTGVKAPVMQFRAMARYAAIVSSNTGDVFGSIVVQLNQFPAAASYTDIFQQYKIKECTVEFNCAATEVVSGSSFAELNNFYTSVNRMALAPSSINEVLDDQDCVVTRAVEKHTRTFVPMFFTATNSVGGGSGLKAETGWLSTAEGNPTTHWGLSYGWPQTSGGYSMIPTVTVLFEFRYQK